MDESQNPTRTIGVDASADDDWSGRVLGEFEILRRLGRGGMGQVFLAEQKSLKRKVAIKVLRPELAANEKALKRFEAEAEAVGNLIHPNIVQVYSYGKHDGLPYMALEYVEGRNLRDFLNRKGPPDLPIALSIMRQVAAALQKAGEQDFVHRDIKPENILLSFSRSKGAGGKTTTTLGAVKVADFGLSTCLAETGQPLNLTQSGVAMGTPLYMSPEQVQGKPVDRRSDIYSFGVTCYHLLSGQPPFRGNSAFDVALKHVQAEPALLSGLRPDLPAELCGIVHKMMAKKPDDRYQTARDILRDLARLRDTMTGAVPAQPALSIPLDAVSSEALATPTQSFTPTSDAMPFVRPPAGGSRRMLFAMLGVGLIGMIIGGVTVRFAVNRLAGQTAASVASIPEPPVTPLITGDERFALDAARQFADPREPAEVRKGLNFQIDLAVYYFKQKRLDDAEKFFRSLHERTYKPIAGTSEHPYRTFAELGQGLVLAFRDEAQKSLNTLSGVLAQFQPPGGGVRLGGMPLAAIIEHFELRRVIAEALNRNARNLGHERFLGTNAHLEALRKPPEVGGRPFRPIFKGDGPKKP